MIAGLWAGGASPRDAASAAAFVHGRAAVLLTGSRSARSVLPTDLLQTLGEAFWVVETVDP